MDNKLSELSKPVGFVSKQAQALLKSGDTASVRPFFDVQGSSPLYSQEFVAALKHKAAVNWEAAASLNVENQELKKRIAELSRLLAHNIERAEEAEKRLATPVRLKKVDSSNVPFAGDGFNAAVDYCAKAVRAAGFTVEGDEQ
ncbi:hypothetical protein [Serratia marcescens]|uniref:hypothetical protein n=1 Tax=Serratia marcescens TaxID=615 RepID=UPI0024A74FF0|nr:hypothetical protein [Serratia marcescens]